MSLVTLNPFVYMSLITFHKYSYFWEVSNKFLIACTSYYTVGCDYKGVWIKSSVEIIQEHLVKWKCNPKIQNLYSSNIQLSSSGSAS